MKRFMKHEKINFFQSPLPSQIKPQLFLQSPRRNWQAWHDCHEDQLFSTPLKQLNSTTQQWMEPEEIVRVEDIEEESESRKNQLMLQNQSLVPEINRKILFSEQEESEQQMLEFTPLKKQFHPNDQQMLNTVQKKLVSYNTPQNEQKTSSPESKLCQRGLKKLAFQAYLFVSSQKRTTYKDVARKLISQLSDQGELEVQKKGELNIKRRVYDALNVLLALGLLKRNGNKIMGRRGDQTLTVRRNCLNSKNSNLDTKDEAAQEEKNLLIRDIKQKEATVTEKRKILQALLQKVANLKGLQNRNKAHHCHKNTIKLPFVMLCPQQLASKDAQSELSIWQAQSQLNLKFPTSTIQLAGDLDILSQVKTQHSRRSNKR